MFQLSKHHCRPDTWQWYSLMTVASMNRTMPLPCSTHCHTSVAPAPKFQSNRASVRYDKEPIWSMATPPHTHLQDLKDQVLTSWRQIPQGRGLVESVIWQVGAAEGPTAYQTCAHWRTYTRLTAQKHYRIKPRGAAHLSSLLSTSIQWLRPTKHL